MATVMPTTLTIRLPEPHARQREFIDSPAPRKIIRAGRRGGKTVGIAILAVEQFLAGRRVLYATPTADQIGQFWSTVGNALAEPIQAGVFVKNETRHTIELPGTKQRIRAKTAWNADTLRGDYADLLILDEWQLMNEDAWELVGAPMLLDNNGDAVFIFTPPSARTASVSKARDKLHANRLFERARQDTTGRWAAFHFTSHDNPHISEEALAELAQDMTPLAYRQEILAESVTEVPGALWTRDVIEAGRVQQAPGLERIVVAVDPAASSKKNSNMTGIVVCGRDENGHGYVLADHTLRAEPDGWARQAISACYRWEADCIVAEDNQGGEMVSYTLRTIDANVPVKLIHASRGKYLRADPISAMYSQGRVHHVGHFPDLEDQMCSWLPGDESPDRLDAMVHGMTELLLTRRTPTVAPTGISGVSKWRNH